MKAYKGKLTRNVISLDELESLALSKKAVWICSWNCVLPAAWVINLPGAMIVRLFRNKMCVYEAAPRKSRRRDNVDSSSSAGSFSWGDSFLRVETKTKQ